MSQGNQVLTLIRFTQAATELFLTQSAVSKQMHALEESLEMPLFERKPRGVALTTAGEELLSMVDVVLERLHHSVRLPAATRMRSIFSCLRGSESYSVRPKMVIAMGRMPLITDAVATPVS